jgi:hypothetical protein
MLGVATTLAALGAPLPGEILRVVVALVSVTLLVLPCLAREPLRLRPSWLGVGLAGALLLNPRTECATLVMVAPLYPLLAVELGARPGARAGRVLASVALIAAAGLITIDPGMFPAVLTNQNTSRPNRPLEGLGLLFLWSLSVLVFLRGTRLSTFRSAAAGTRSAR